jgi:NSS family neurotransmitter:Na+ symporter
VRTLTDWRVSRRRAVGLTVAGAFLVGVPSALDLDVLGNQDFVWGVALMVSGAFIASLVSLYGPDRLSREVATDADWALPRIWHAVIRWAIPMQAVILLAWWGWQATTPGFLGEGGHWYDPFNPFSLMTCLVQWGMVIVAALACNRWMARRVAGGESPSP